MSQLRAAAVALVSAVVGITLWQWLPEDQQPVIPRSEVVKEYVIAPPSAKAADTDMALANPLGQPNAAPVKPAPAANTLGQRLLATKDIKAFVSDALKHPEQGGAYYASLALERCQYSYQSTKRGTDEVIRRVVESGSTISPERMSAINAAADQCAGFSEGEVATLEAEASRLASEGRDPLSVQAIALNSAEGTPDYDKALEAVYISGNATLVSGLFVPQRLISMTKTDDNGVITHRFNGQSYVGETEKRILEAGADLGACVEDDYCSLDEAVFLRCRIGDCYATREEYMREQMLSGNQAALDRATKIAEQIKQAIARGDRSIFR